jgi:hypothetical protein
LPTFNDGNTYYIAKTGADANAGSSAAPKLTLKSLFDTSKSYADLSGNANDLTEVGTLPFVAYPCWPIPPQGKYAAGPFSDSNYLRDTGGGLYGSLTGATAFSIELMVFVHNFSNNPVVWAFNDGASDNYLQILSDGGLVFRLNGIDLTSAAGTITGRSWFYIKCVFSSGVTGGKRIYAGPTPETAVLVASATQTHTVGTGADFMVGRYDGATGSAFSGYIDRVLVTTDYNTDLPTRHDAANLQGYYPMETAPLLQSAPKDYIVIKDSEEYDEALTAKFQYDIPAGLVLYAADGQTPKFKLTRGATPGTYGQGNTSYAAPSALIHYVINKTTGDDATGSRDAGGTGAGNPFKTIQAALSHGSRAAADVFEIQDSEEYVEDLTLGTLSLTIQAKAGSHPTLKPLTNTSGSDHMTATGAITATLAGLRFIGVATNQVLFDPGANAAALSLQDCTLQEYLTYNQGSGATTVTMQDCLVKVYRAAASSTMSGGTGVVTLRNCYFDGNLSTHGSYSGRNYLDLDTVQAFNCSFIKLYQVAAARQAVNAFIDQCYFDDSIIALYCIGVAGVRMYPSITNSDFNITTASVVDTGVIRFTTAGDANAVIYGFAYNCHIKFAASLTGIYEWAFLVSRGVTGELYCGLYECSIDGGYIGYTAAGAAFAYIYNWTTIGCTSSAYAATSGQGVVRSALDVGSAAVLTSGITGTFIDSTSDIFDSSSDAKNIAILPTERGIYTGDALGKTDVGYGHGLFDILLEDFTIDGLSFEGVTSREGAVRSTNDVPFTLRYCSFFSSGIYAVMASERSTIEKCYFEESSAHSLRTGRNSVTFSRNAGNLGSGPFILNAGQGTEISNNSSYACMYGLYDVAGAVPRVIQDCVFASSLEFDYSGDGLALYSCIGTLDPDRANSVDANSTRKDPLYRDPENGDLRLMAEAAGGLFTSPAKGTGTAAADMGAFAFTYGTASTAWTTVDFGTSGYYNPDRVVRNLRAINLSEEDRDDLGLKSNAFGFRTEYQLSWAEQNAMPAAQVTALAAAFSATTNQVQIQLDGSTWIDGYLVRGEGFEYAEEPGYTDDSLPTPLRSLAVRVA